MLLSYRCAVPFEQKSVRFLYDSAIIGLSVEPEKVSETVTWFELRFLRGRINALSAEVTPK